jgi:hypothetical protein
MVRFLNAAISGFATWQLFMRVGLSPAAAFVCFLVLFVTLSMITGGLTGGIWNSGLWTTLPVRRFIGLTAEAVLWGFLAWVASGLAVSLNMFNRVGEYLYLQRPQDAEAAYLVAYAVWGWFVFIMPLFFFKPLKILIGRVAGPVARFVRARFVGMGGSSSFGGLFHDWAHPWKPGQLVLGSSMYSPNWKVGRSDDRHFITIATSRSGKGRSGIIPNLLTWPGSALVIDPKGQNAAVTAAARGDGGGRVKKGMGQTIRIVDPFGELKGQGVDVPVHRFNPLEELNPEAPDIVEQINTIADALVVPDPHGNQFFDRSARNVISGVIGTVLGHPSFEGKRSLVSV